MKRCSECGKNSPIHSGFCVICGTRLDLPGNVRRERFLFFLTPIFLVILGIAIFVELGIPQPMEPGMAFGGAFAVIYIVSGAIFWAITRIFSLPATAESYWQAGMFTLIHLLACITLTYNLEILIFGSVVKGMGLLEYNESRLSVLAAIYLPTLFTGILAISVRARFKQGWQNGHGKIKAFLLSNATILITVLTLVVAILISFSQPQEVRKLVESRMLYELDASEKAIVVASQALEKKEDFAPLHYLLGSAILDAAPASFTPADALYHLQRAIALVPDNAFYLYKVSIAHDLEKNYDKAIEAASAAVSLQNNDAFLWQHLGELNLKYRKFDQAIVAYKEALKLEPHSPTLLNNLAFTYLEVDRNLPDALALARRSVEMLPGFVFNTDTLAWAFYKNGMYPDALESISSLYADRTELSAEVDFHYAMILFANGLLAEPIKTLEKLLARPEAISDPLLLRQILGAKEKILLENPKLRKGEKIKNE